MANVPTLVHTETFANTDTINVVHGYGSIHLYAKLIIDGIAQSDKIKCVDLDDVDPTNKLVVKLTSSETGTLQLFASDLFDVCDGNPSFGSAPYEVESLDESSTIGTDWEEKLRMGVTDVPAGRYRIGWCYSWRASSTSSDFIGRLQLDDTDIVMSHRQKPTNNSSDQNMICSGFAYVNLTAGDHHFDIDYTSETDSTTAYIWNARLELWRKS